MMSYNDKTILLKRLKNYYKDLIKDDNDGIVAGSCLIIIKVLESKLKYDDEKVIRTTDRQVGNYPPPKRPKRYSSREVHGMDVIDLVHHWGLNFNQGNILKYLLRDKGEDIQDLEKIIDYAQRELEQLKKDKNDTN